MDQKARNLFSPLRAAGFSLVEATLSLGLSAFCLVAIFGLLPLGLKSNQTATEETAATGFLSMVAADLRATPPAKENDANSTSGQFQIPIPANPVTVAPTPTQLYFNGEGRNSACCAADSRYRLTVTFLPNGSNVKAATLANLQISWPATVDPAQARGCTQTFVALDRN